MKAMLISSAALVVSACACADYPPLPDHYVSQSDFSQMTCKELRYEYTMALTDEELNAIKGAAINKKCVTEKT